MCSRSHEAHVDYGDCEVCVQVQARSKGMTAMSAKLEVR